MAVDHRAAADMGMSSGAERHDHPPCRLHALGPLPTRAALGVRPTQLLVCLSLVDFGVA